LGELNL